MSHVPLIILTCVILCVLASATFDQKKQAHRPPWITKHPPVEKAYKLGERTEMLCRADGTPLPTYRWQKNGEWLTVTGLDIKQVPNEGTLMIDDPKASHEGIYQCFASNTLGTAASVKTILRKAVLEPFPTVKDPVIHRISVGESLVLRCHPPHSYPTASIYWGENRNASKLRPIENTARVSQDYSGNLYFVNVQEEDSLNDPQARYFCAIFNSALRSLVQGNDQRIIPIISTASPKYESPKHMWSSPGLDVAVKGQPKKMKCIFSGYPTPEVSWFRLDTTMNPTVQFSSFGQELVIPEVDFTDAGRYQCAATNREHSDPQVKDFTLTVESPPFWRNKPPEDVNTSEEENAVFECLVNGHPKPTVTWYINGVLEEDSQSNNRRTVGPGWLRYDNVTKTDAQVIQCNASNAHGYIFANAYLNVLAEAPVFLDTPQQELKVAEGQTAILKCQVFGAPKPTLIWQKGVNLEDVTDLDNDHFNVLDNGNLRIVGVRKEDQDMYQCYVFNKFGTEAAAGKLLVTERTMIIDPPLSQVVMAGVDVSFTCNATTDSGELAHLIIEWRREGKALATDDADARWTVRDDGRELKLKNIMVEDSGNYMCHASNGLDSDSVSFVVTVKDRPEPPYNIKVRCTAMVADISWTPGSDSNEQVMSYTVYFNTSHDEAGKFQEAEKVSNAKNSARIKLRPWTNYTFHVTAENAVGISERSELTSALCSTPQDSPHRNPHRVCTESREPGILIIIWEPMLRTEHNGVGFHYLISYKRHDLPGAQEIQYKEHDWRQSELQVTGQEVYKKYEISVQAVNDMGGAPELERKLGYSGEDAPLVIPEDFKLVDGTLNSTNALFRWQPVDTSPAAIRGFFRGYQIKFWKVDDEANFRTEDIIQHTWHPCVSLHHGNPRRRRETTDGLIEAATYKLWPFSTITAGVLVLNGGKSGKLSPTITFETPEGLPGAVPAFWVSERGSHHLRLSWTAPFEANGILRGYTIRYKKAPPAMDTWHDTYVPDPQQTYKKIYYLDSDTSYLLIIWAENGAGKGREMTIEETTVSENVPDKPSIELDSGYDFMNVSWLPSGKQPPRSPGIEFIVRYKQQYTDDWKETPPQKDHNWFNVTDLENGKMYDFYIIALNRKGDRMNSDHKVKTVGWSSEPIVQSAASYTWLIALICLLLLILMVLLIIFLIYRNRGGKYPVYEKEKLHGNKGKLDEEPTFGEYVRTEDSMIKKSQGSLESSSKSEEDGSDSLGAYEDVDPTKFNDEGSFVDQAGYKKPTASETKPLTDHTSSSAMTAFV